MNNSTAFPAPEQVSPTAPTTFNYNTNTPPAIIKKKYEVFPLYNEKNPMLKNKMVPFDFASVKGDELVEFARRLDFTCNHYGGAGLAAPQCGFPYRIFVMAGGLVCVNPAILEASEETVRDREGCLSFPGFTLPIARPKTVRVEYYTVAGERKEEVFTGATARVFQHELDHLNGKLFTSLVGSLTLQMARKKQQKLFKKMERIVAAKNANARYTGRK